MLDLHQVRWDNGSSISGWKYRGQGDQPWGFDDQYIGVERITETIVLMRAPDGRRFETMRGLFAGFRLRLCACDRRSEPLVRLQLALRAIDLHLPRHGLDWIVDDAFQGSIAHMEDYLHWLETEDLVRCDGSQIADAVLSPEGRAALHLLDLTAAGSNFDSSPVAIHRMRAERKIPCLDAGPAASPRLKHGS